MIRTLHRALAILEPRERVRLALLGAIAPLAALGEMCAVVVMLPFLSAVVNPAATRVMPGAADLLAWLGLVEHDEILLVVGSVALSVLIVTNAFILISSWLMLRFSSALNHRLSSTLLEKYLNKPYPYFLSKNSATLANTILGQVGQVTDSVVGPALAVFSRGTAALAIVTLLALANPALAAGALGLVSCVYTIFYVSLAKRRLTDLGARRMRTQRALGQLVSEAFGGIKDVKLLHAEKVFSETFRPLSLTRSRDHVNQAMIATSPRYIVEAVAFGGILLGILLAASRKSDSADAASIMPMLGIFAFAAYRLLPSVQQVFANLVTVRANLAAVESLIVEMAPEPPEAGDGALSAPPASGVVASSLATNADWPRQSIELRQVTFAYPGAAAAALENVNLRLEAKTTIGIVGPTGSGKTTVVDLLLGLLRPSQGELRVDNQRIDATNVERWQSCIGYVPQHIYLSDASIARNVAFGVPEPQIDQARVEEACRRAMLHEFITERLPHAYATTVGERGVRSSGGERQRIGIARALYRQPRVLILDEATSALDPQTEAEVMQAIHQLAGEKTLIMIAHRVSTLRRCDVIYRITRGRLELVGSYASLVGEEAPQPTLSDGRAH